jgi:hypothetical protein
MSAQRVRLHLHVPRASGLFVAHSQLLQARELLQGGGQRCHAIGAQPIFLQLQGSEPCRLLQGRGQQGRSFCPKAIACQVTAATGFLGVWIFRGF